MAPRTCLLFLSNSPSNLYAESPRRPMARRGPTKPASRDDWWAGRPVDDRQKNWVKRFLYLPNCSRRRERRAREQTATSRDTSNPVSASIRDSPGRTEYRVANIPSGGMENRCLGTQGVTHPHPPTVALLNTARYAFARDGGLAVTGVLIQVRGSAGMSFLPRHSVAQANGHLGRVRRGRGYCPPFYTWGIPRRRGYIPRLR